MNSMVKRSTDSNLSFSRSSQIKIPQERYLTKEEVLVKCKTITLNQSSITNNSQLEPFISSHNTSQSDSKSGAACVGHGPGSVSPVAPVAWIFEPF